MPSGESPDNPATVYLILKPHKERGGYQRDRFDAYLGEELISTSKSGWHTPARELLVAAGRSRRCCMSSTQVTVRPDDCAQADRRDRAPRGGGAVAAEQRHGPGHQAEQWFHAQKLRAGHANEVLYQQRDRRDPQEEDERPPSGNEVADARVQPYRGEEGQQGELTCGEFELDSADSANERSATSSPPVTASGMR